MPASPSQSWNSWNGNVIPEEQGSSTGASSSTIQDDVVRTCGESEVDISLDALGTQFESHRYASTDFPDTITKTLEVFGRIQV